MLRGLKGDVDAGPRAELFRTLRLATSTPAQLDKLIDELAKGKAMEKILRS